MQKRRPIGRPLAELIGDSMSPALAAHGFAGREVVSRWPEIAGERLAERSRPLKIEWPRQRPGGAGERGDPATLVVQVESAFALELQHLAPVILQRINGRLGWAAVGRIVMKQGPVAAPPPPSPPEAPLAPEAAERLASAAGQVESDGLRAALTRLGEGAIRRGDASARPPR